MLWQTILEQIVMTNNFLCPKEFHDKKSCIRETLDLLINLDRSGGRTDRRTNIYKLLNLKKKLFYVVFDLKTVTLVIKKRKKLKSLIWNISRIVSSLAKTGARTFDQNFVWPPEEGDLQWPSQTNKQT